MKRKTWKWQGIVCITGLLGLLLLLSVFPAATVAKAKESNQVPRGVSVNGKDLSGTDMGNLRAELESIGQELSQGKVILSIDGNNVETTLENLGIGIDLETTENEIKQIGKKGNIVARYKELKDAEREGRPVGISLSWEEAAAVSALDKICGQYEEPAVDYGLSRENGQFRIIEGKVGYQVAKEEAREAILSALQNEWDGASVTVDLALEKTEPKGSQEELEQVQDVLGEFTTSYSGSSSSRAKNIERGASLANGTLLYPGEKCSFRELVSPIEIDNGYFVGPSYASGQVVESVGGGICQVSTTLYEALLRAEVEINERSNHSMLVTYVEPAMDAAIAGDIKDLKFTNNLNAPIFIEAEAGNHQVTFRVYGLETRPANRRLEFKSVELSSTEPEVQLMADWGAGAGSVSTVESPHRGCKAKLVKQVYIDNQLVEETDVNTSTYKMTPKKISVGMLTENSELYLALQAAVDANDLDSVNAALGAYVAVIPAEGEAVPASGEGVSAVTPDAIEPEA